MAEVLGAGDPGGFSGITQGQEKMCWKEVEEGKVCPSAPQGEGCERGRRCSSWDPTQKETNSPRLATAKNQIFRKNFGKLFPCGS